MKTIKALIIMAVLLFAAQVWGAGSAISVSGDSIIYSPALNRQEFRVITIIFTGDSVTGAIPDLTLNADTAGLGGRDTRGWNLYKVDIDCNHAGTEPTENSELYIFQHGVDLLGGNGVDKVDNTAEASVYAETDGLPMVQPIVDDLTVRITQQAAATASATGTIYLILVP